MFTHSNQYSDNRFWKKIVTYIKKAGKTLVIRALILYYVLQDDDTPTWAKTTIIGALGYLLSPVDAIPDFTAIIGLTDDAAVLAQALAVVAVHVKDQHINQAYAQWDRWVGRS